jgi:hypothetical protein
MPRTSLLHTLYRPKLINSITLDTLLGRACLKQISSYLAASLVSRDYEENRITRAFHYIPLPKTMVQVVKESFRAPINDEDEASVDVRLDVALTMYRLLAANISFGRKLI